MDLFISKNQSLSLGLIMNKIGNDTRIIEKIMEGTQRGSFELAYMAGSTHLILSSARKSKNYHCIRLMKKCDFYLETSLIFSFPHKIYTTTLRLIP
jgi:hypothetical protein